jgi:hypothetical protein
VAGQIRDKGLETVGEFANIRKINAILKRDNIIFKVIIVSTLKEFCFWVKDNLPP